MRAERSINLHVRAAIALPTNLRRHAALSMLVVLGFVAAVVVARRLAGAIAYPLPPAMLMAAGTVVAAVAAAIRLSWFLPSTITPSPRLDWIVMLGTSLAAAMLVFGLYLPDTMPVGALALCMLPAIEESWAWGRHVRRSRQMDVSPSHQAMRLDAPHAAVPHALHTAAIPRAVSPLAVDNGCPPNGVTQRLIRSQSVDGTEELSGWLRTAFAVGQRTGSLHVAFCPPFAVVPELTVEQIDGPEARVKTAQLLPYGVRLDLKLAAPAEEPTSVVLQFSARTSKITV